MTSSGDGKKFKAIFNNSLDAIIIVSRTGTIIEANNASKKLFQKRNLSGLKLDSLVSIANIIQSDLKRTRGVVQVNSRFLGFTRSKGFSDKTSIFFFRDVTEAKIEEKRREHFLSIVSHEFKNPLAVIKALAYLTQKTSKKRDLKTDEYLQRINEKVDTLTRLLDELLDVTRIRQGQIPLKKTKQDLTKVVRKTVSDFRLLNPSFKIELSGKGPGKFYFDKERINQVLINLLRNAIMYSGNSKVIEVNIKTLKKSVQVSVKDFGVGIRPEEQKKVFELYYRQPENTNPRGLGVGLFISKEIVRSHNGKIKVKSREGRGSKFTFTIPFNKVYTNEKQNSTG